MAGGSGSVREPGEFPVITSMQRIVLYETKARFYLVGSNNTETKFRVLKIDRMEPKELVIHDDKIMYSQREIRNLLMMIDVGNRSRNTQKGTTGLGLSRTVSAFGIVGFVRFLEGYYIVLITKRRKIALIGHHTIYKIEDIFMQYIPSDGVRQGHPDESRYVKMFQNMDLSSNFYFSYSYDLTHTLQYNLTPSRSLEKNFNKQHGAAETEDVRNKKEKPNLYIPVQDPGQVEDANFVVPDVQSIEYLDSSTDDSTAEDKSEEAKGATPEDRTAKQAKTPADQAGDCVYGVRHEPTEKFVWNKYLMSAFESKVHYDWVIHVIHGFIGQSNVIVFGRHMYLTLIARRSNHFAGTRFLKRGANCEGQVANEVETEQIVQDTSILTLSKTRISSFVQMRGSIPLFWSQDYSKMVPKPPIFIDQGDPYFSIAGQHFNSILRRSGAPVIILNLVKTKEIKKGESMLSDEFQNALKYLNQFLPPEYAIQYIGFDMARMNKRKNANVLGRLAEIATQVVRKTGFFHSKPELFCNEIRPEKGYKGMQGLKTDKGMKQRGIVRTNCVDCLDRTNTAQFAIGKCALASQLYAMGVIESPSLEFDSDCIRMLEELYEDHGDTLALQYGGSQLVHRIESYRKSAPWTSHSRDIMQTLSRYYSNTFSDTDKQHAINLFLGVFKPDLNQLPIWDLPTDFYMHNYMASGEFPMHRKSYAQWWDSPVSRCLPMAYEEVAKGSIGKVQVIKTTKDDELVNIFNEYYRPYELTSLEELYSFHMPNSIKNFMPKTLGDFSPFSVRGKTQRRQDNSGVPIDPNPNISGKESTASLQSTASSDTSSDSDSDSVEGDFDTSDTSEDFGAPRKSQYVSFKVRCGRVAFPKSVPIELVPLRSASDFFPTMKQVYGVQISEPDKQNKAIYKKYTQIGMNASKTPEVPGPVGVGKQSACRKVAGKGTTLIRRSIFSLDSSYHVTPPTVSRRSKEIYQNYVKIGKEGAQAPTLESLAVYQEYVSNLYM